MFMEACLFLEDGKLHGTGTDIFPMWKMEQKGWILSGVADISREVDEKAFDASGEADAVTTVLGLD